jgi:hypothetical protein
MASRNPSGAQQTSSSDVELGRDRQQNSRGSNATTGAAALLCDARGCTVKCDDVWAEATGIGVVTASRRCRYGTDRYCASSSSPREWNVTAYIRTGASAAEACTRPGSGDPVPRGDQEPAVAVGAVRRQPRDGANHRQAGRADGSSTFERTGNFGAAPGLTRTPVLPLGAPKPAPSSCHGQFLAQSTRAQPLKVFEVLACTSIDSSGWSWGRHRKLTNSR